MPASCSEPPWAACARAAARDLWVSHAGGSAEGSGGRGSPNAYSIRGTCFLCRSMWYVSACFARTFSLGNGLVCSEASKFRRSCNRHFFWVTYSSHTCWVMPRSRHVMCWPSALKEEKRRRASGARQYLKVPHTTVTNSASDSMPFPRLSIASNASANESNLDRRNCMKRLLSAAHWLAKPGRFE